VDYVVARKKNQYHAEAQRMTENELGTIIVDAAIAVHRELGPGLLETVYELGTLLNFGEALMKDGITRAVNGLEE